MFTSSWSNNNQQNQQQTPSAFGQPSAFGSTTNNAFGSTSAFGQPQQPAQPAPQVNPMFGNISAPAAAAPSTGFGAFGNTANTSTSAFGAPKPATGFGAFGGGSTSAFGGTTTGAFGQPTTTPAPATTSVFGQPSTTTSAFGAFGGNKFGATSTTTGTTTHPVVTTGTANPPYSVTEEKDTNGTQQFQTITCMPQYIGYSQEELRIQDYAQNRKTATTTTGAFGQSAFGAAAQPATTSIFGAQPAQQPTTSVFGNTNTTGTTNAFGAFGQPGAQPATNTGSVFGGGTSAFGQTQPQQQSAFSTTNAFGQTQQPQQQQTSIFGGGGTSAFGNAAKPANAFSAFGGTGTSTGTNAFGTGTGTSAFGAQPQQPAQTTNIFGSTQPAANTQTSAFGAFGNTANALKPSVFGTPANTQTTTSPFGAFGNTQQQQQTQPQQNAQPSIFGGNNLFGQQPQQQQNQQQPQTTSLFGGGQTNTTPSLFGNTNTGTTNLFGNTNTQQQQIQQQQGQQPATNLFGNMFNKPAQPTTSLFGGGALTQTQTNTNQQQQQQPSLFGGSTFGQNNQTNSLFGNKPAATPLGNSLSGGQGMNNSMFGGNGMSTSQGSLTASIAQPISDNLPIFAMLPPGPRSVDLEPHVASPKKRPGFFYDMPVRTPVPRIGLNYTPANSKLRGYGSVSSMASSTNGLNNLKGSMSFTTGKPGALALTNSEALSSSTGPDFLGRSGSPALGTGGRQSVKKVILDKKVDPADLFVKTGSPGASRKGKIVFSPQMTAHAREQENAAFIPVRPPQESPTAKPKTQAQNKTTSHGGAHTGKETPEIQEEVSATELVHGDYWVKPDLATLKKAGYDQLSAFEGLVVGRKGYGEVHFLEPVDLTGLPKLGSLLGDIVRFDDKECSVYPDCDEGDKPPPGAGLNVKSKVILERCWAVDKATREPITDPNAPQAAKHLKRLKKMNGTTFVSFDHKTGTWTFTVDQF
ncbi:hypothetical protein D9613_004951 [Agrocybe pediades]|uniref:Peptidase S59 domain-containing protein n=1 Tax=Agrocybe pediades TaxID=84607 RepID=A0A8H4QZM3_9AGAR|nr:hypothetical protein D9613_004951 [Agrocybe pediades]